jgi:hypothetical protein
MVGDLHLYYGDRRVFIPGSAPWTIPPETLDNFRLRVLTAGIDIDRCTVDFSHLASKEQLSGIIDTRYRVGLEKFDRAFNSALAVHISNIFRAGAFVPCREFLKEESSR